MLELLGLLDRNGFSCWIFSGGGTDFMRTWTADGYGLPPHRVIGSVGETEFRVGDGGPELVKTAKVEIVNDGPQKPSSIHRHVGQRPILAAGNTDGDLAMLQWTAASPYRTLELVVHHTDGDREYAYDRDPILGSGTDQILAAAAEHKWTVITWPPTGPSSTPRPPSTAWSGSTSRTLAGWKSPSAFTNSAMPPTWPMCFSARSGRSPSPTTRPPR